ncbi:MAG: AAA family ATPase [Opitutaceae bacterium]|nr:AAA family ATPase [Opitutaceae bacterium]
MSPDDPLASDLIPAPLRDALRHSPNNAPLLVHIAETVLKGSGYPTAEALFKRALALEPSNLDARLGLALAFFQQGKHSAALVIVEDLTKPAQAPARALLLHARLALRAGEPRQASQLYQRALAADPSARDPDLARRVSEFLPTPAPAAEKSPAFELPGANPGAPEGAAGAEPDAGAEGRERQAHGGAAEPAGVPEIEHPKITFADVGGMERIKEEIRMKIVLPLKQPELFKAYGKKAGGGILLYGPPGCGKTFLARATAGEVESSFLAVGINEVLEMWIGQSEKNLHAVFEQARGHRPCVLFFDEVDALGANRTDLLKTGGRQLINQFLNELDGVSASNEGVLILAATNAPWHLDPAFRRPGRFDRILFVPPPDLEARGEILRLHLAGKPCGAIDWTAVAKKTDGFSGADLKAVVDLAVESCLREAMKSGKVRPIGEKDLLAGVKAHRPTTRDWFETARNHALYANQSGLYDEVLAHLKLKP